MGYRLSDVCHLSFFLAVTRGGADRRCAASRSDPGEPFSDRRGYGDEPVRPRIRFIGGLRHSGGPEINGRCRGHSRGRCHAGKYSARFDHGVNDDNHRFLPHHAGSKKNEGPLSLDSSGSLDTSMYLPKKLRVILAVFIPLVFLADIICMIVYRLQGNEATALVGGTAIGILLIVHFIVYKERHLEKITEYFIGGFQFGFKVFGPVIPIAAFFYLGDAGFKSILNTPLPKGSAGIVNDLGLALSHSFPMSGEFAGIALAAVGAITGLDGSGFSGISLAGSMAKLFSAALHTDPAVLTALGQISAIWVGGGTLVPWALIPAAAICKVDPFELARKNFIPVAAGLVVTTIAAIIILP